MKNVTLADIAAKTGYSINTISHVLHNKPDISEKNLCVEEINVTTERTIEALLNKSTHYDAVICFSDLIAMQVCHFLKKSGKRIPQDVSVIDFDNIASNFYFSPILSSVSPSKRKMAAFAIEELMRMLETKDLTPINKVFGTRLVLRDTTNNK
ncbi:MAG: LacI family DNA-binding transcriptional regulator [Clostridia bacterium]|nr:LacI family DNA-binding transcriptional regulator [Clostridia bacterium]